MDLDAGTSPVINVHTYPSAPLLARVLHPVCLQNDEVVEVNLGVWDSFVQPGLSQGYDAGFPVGSLHQAFCMECIHFISERPYISLMMQWFEGPSSQPGTNHSTLPSLPQ